MPDIDMVIIDMVIKGLSCCAGNGGVSRSCPDDCPYANVDETNGLCEAQLKWDAKKLLEAVKSAHTVSGWIPFKQRPLDDEECEDHPNWAWIWDCPLPDDGQEILVSSKRYVWKDEWFDDCDGSGLESGAEIGDDWAWRPMPKPYKPPEEE